MEYTPNLNLKKPSDDDFYNVKDFNDNADAIDAAIKANQTAIAGKAPTSHTHTKSQISDFPTSMPPTAHTHDDRYYTESEMDTKLAGKAPTSHGNHVPATQTADNATFLRNDNTWAKVTPGNIGAAASSHKHTKSEITDFPSSMPASDVYNWAKQKTKPAYTASEVGASETGHTHDDRYYTESEMDTKLAGKANSSHAHDDRYYTESEMDTKLAGKAASSHTHTKSQITDFPSTMTPSAHNQAASTITAGTLAGKVLANATAQATLSDAQVRNISAGTTDLTAGSSTLASGTLYVVYE